MVKKKSICLFCSLGCGVAFRTEGNQVLALDYDKENPINRGSLCPRGHSNFELLNHPGRLTEPMIGKRKTSWEEAASLIRQELKQFSRDETGILISTLCSNEDAFMAAKLAKTWGIKNICAAGETGDLEAEVPKAVLAAEEDIENAETLLIVGDLLNRVPVLSRRINKVKYGKRGNRIMVIDPNRTRTAWFATNHLAINPGTEVLLLTAMAGEVAPDLAAQKTGISAEKINAAASEFNASSSGVIILVPERGKTENDLAAYFCKKLSTLSANKKYITYSMGGNTAGVGTVLGREISERISFSSICKKIEKGEIKALLSLGGNGSEGEKKLQKIKFSARADFFLGDSALDGENTVVLPLASHLETEGTYVLADGRHENLRPVAPKVGAKSAGEIAALLLGEEFNREEVRRVIKEEKANYG